MKKNIIVLLAVIFLFVSGSCKSDNVDSSSSIKDALKISTWVLDESVEGNDYYVLDENTGKTVDNENVVYTFERLKENEVKKLAPMGYNYMPNLNFLIEYDGMIEIEPEGEYIQLAFNKENTAVPLLDVASMEGTFEKIDTAYEIYVNVCPFHDGSIGVGAEMVHLDVEVGREYYINVNAYRLADKHSPIIKARLKLVALEDAVPPKKTVFSPYGENSRFLSVELVSYEFGDKYRFYDENFVEDE